MKLNRVKDVAEILALHKISVYNLITAGQLKAVRVGRAVRVSDQEIDRFVSAHTDTTGAPVRPAPPHIQARVAAATARA